MRTIVVPVVRSPAGRKALETAKEDARLTGAELVLVSTAAVSDRLAEDVETVRSKLSALEKELVDEGLQCRTFWFVGESLGEATLYAAKETDADLIVMSVRRRTPVGKVILGSYEQEILLEAPCAVLCIPEAALDSSAEPE